MPYCFMNLRRGKDHPGWERDFPGGVSYLLLADLRELKWGIYCFSLEEPSENWKPANPVGRELSQLIESGKRYPPALAIARNQKNHVFGNRKPTKKEFAKAYAKEIRSRLQQQPEAPFVLAKALQGDGIDLVPGEWHWVLRVRGCPPQVSWVSDDFFVYQNPVSDFELTPEQIDRLSDN